MRVLAFDTSSQLTAVAVCEGEQVLAQEADVTTERHAQTLLPRVQACLQRAGWTLPDVQLLAVGIGPGSFTGVRVGLATAKGLALGLGLPVRGVVSLAAIARAVFDEQPEASPVLTATLLDAHKGELFGALYACAPDGELRAVVEPLHGKPAAVMTTLMAAAGERRVLLAGAGRHLYPTETAAHLGGAVVLPDAFDAPSAVALAREALRGFTREGASELASLAPMYLRDSDAQLPKSPLRL